MSPIGKMKVSPFGEDHMKEAFIGLVSFLNSDEKACTAFQTENYERRSELFEMEGAEAFGVFADWVAVNHWGIEEGAQLDKEQS
jgi:hypothetical protein